MSFKKMLLNCLYFFLKWPRVYVLLALGLIVPALVCMFIIAFFFNKSEVSCPSGAKKIEGKYRVDVIKAPFRTSPDDNSSKVVNQKASYALQKDVFIDLALGYELSGFCQKNGWIYAKIMRINGMSASSSEYGWVQKKYVSAITNADIENAEKEESENDEKRPFPLLSSKMKCRSAVAESMNLANPPAINAMTRQDNADGSRLFFVTVEHSNAPAERVKCLVSTNGEVEIGQ